MGLVKGARSRVDLLIAATALARGFLLVTGNTSDFSWITGLAVERLTPELDGKRAMSQ